ncbi:MAG: hypothetical protein R2816_06315 [Flavobacteriaceae bacterium]|nr:hypothetical protein [Flavobacteriaceae bacterium]
MHKTTLTLLIAFFCLSNSQLFAQHDFAKIEKNINVLASGLYHDLNATKDTLVLKSDSKISYIYDIHNKMKHDINNRVYATNYKVGLRDLAKGKHMFVVVQDSLKIVFVVRIFGDTPTIVASNN